MKLGRWSATAASNNSSPPDGFPEGQATSTFNDAMREMMASIRTVLNESQFFDADLTPTFVNATSFTLAGDQTPTIKSGRRLKMNDTTAVYATVTTASFTAVTTIQLAPDSGGLTAALSSFGMGIVSRVSGCFPDGMSLSAASLNIAGSLSAASMSIGGSYSLSATMSSTCKAFVGFTTNTAGSVITIVNSFNVSSVSRSATAVYRVNFTSPFVDTVYGWTASRSNTGAVSEVARLVASFKFANSDPDPLVGRLDVVDRQCNIVFFR